MSSKVGAVLGTMTFGNTEKGAQTNQEDATKMMQMFADSPVSGDVPEFDSARMYQGGYTECVLGNIMKENPNLGTPKCSYSTKANPWFKNSLNPAALREQLEASVKNMGFTPVDIFYLHGPDANTPIEDTLQEVQKLHEEKQFVEFGLSNFTAWETACIHAHMDKNGWIKPTVYQGMYNGLTRAVEEQLFPCLRRLGIRFYAYNPLAGGVLSGKYKLSAEADKDEKEITEGRFNKNTVWGKAYQKRFMQQQQLQAVDLLRAPCDKEGIPMAQAALRWMMHHSKLVEKDRVIIGASKMEHFSANLEALSLGPLPESITKAFDEAWGLTEDRKSVV